MIIFVKLNASSIAKGITISDRDVVPPNCIQVPQFDVSILGKKYENGAFVDVPAAPVTTITRKAFLRRFTAAEREALENIKATATQARKDKLNAFLIYIADGVDLDDQYVISVVNALETFGVLASGRAAQILAA